MEAVAGLTVRTENGFITVACNGIQYMDNDDQLKGWGVMFSENDTDIYSQIMQTIIEGSIEGGIEAGSDGQPRTQALDILVTCCYN